MTTSKKRKVSKEGLPSEKSTKGTEEDAEFPKEMYASLIKSALEALDNNNSMPLNTFAEQISRPKSHPEHITPQHLCIILMTLTNSISRLDSKQADNIILSIINYRKWWTLEHNVILVFKKFIVTLCSYLPRWWTEISSILIQQFILPTSKTEYHHELLRYFISIIPTSVESLGTQLAISFPSKSAPKAEVVNYVSNLLKIVGYCDELLFKIWSLVIDHSIQIDVGLQNELDELDDDDSDLDLDLDDNVDDEAADDDDSDSDSDEEQSDGDGEDPSVRRVHFALDTQGGYEDEDGMEMVEDVDNEDSEEDYDSDEEVEEDNVNEQDVKASNIVDLADKLDAILSMVFDNLKNVKVQSDDKDEEERAIVLYNTLISLFKSHILPTYYTKSTQFILFLFTQMSPDLMDSFLVTLIDLCFAPDESIEKRIKALQYLSSYLARAEMLQTSQIVFVLKYLINWLNRYVEEREIEIVNGVNMDRFKLFYSTFQVLLYVFCFRHSVLKDEDDDWVLGLDKFFQRMVITKFNPLKFCNENVVLMFAKIAQEENVAYCFSIIQKNKNERLKGISGTKLSSGTSQSNTKLHLAAQQFVDLEGYFPFDPMFLKNSKRHLRGYFIEWVSRDYDSDTDDFDDLANDAQELVRRNSMNRDELSD